MVQADRTARFPQSRKAICCAARLLTFDERSRNAGAKERLIRVLRLWALKKEPQTGPPPSLLPRLIGATFPARRAVPFFPSLQRGASASPVRATRLFLPAKDKKETFSKKECPSAFTPPKKVFRAPPPSLRHRRRPRGEAQRNRFTPKAKKFSIRLRIPAAKQRGFVPQGGAELRSADKIDTCSGAGAKAPTNEESGNLFLGIVDERLFLRVMVEYRYFDSSDIFLYSISTSMGFAIWPFIPVASAAASSSRKAFAVIARIGI